MRLLSGPAKRLAGRPALLLATDPGPALLEAVRLYDPRVRHWGGGPLRDRLVLRNDILLFGPVQVTQKLAEQVGLPAGARLAWYTSVAASRQPGQEAARREEGERLVRGLAARLGGSTHPARLQPDLALILSVFSEQAVSSESAIEVLRPFAGELAVDDVTAGTYSLTGKDAPFYTAYWPPAKSAALPAPPAVGPLYGKALHHWDLHSGQHAGKVSRELCQTMAEAALALAAVCGGMVVDVFGFPVSRPGDVQPA